MDLELDIERPVAGGDMLARHDGRIVFVSGAIPGERVRARVIRRRGGVTWAETREVLEASPDRREPGADPRCGGRAYAHVAYPRQLALKADVIADAFRRLARRPLDAVVPVLGSPEAAYRVRARLHVSQRRLGFLREGTHQWCDAAATGQLSSAALEAIDGFALATGDGLLACDSVLLSEDTGGAGRVLVCTLRQGAALEGWIGRPLTPGVTGVVVLTTRGHFLAAGADRLIERSRAWAASAETGVPDVTWARRGASFFQGNRFLVGPLLERVLNAAQGDRFIDLYAGVGLFAIPMAARGQRGLAVEGDEFSSGDLSANAQAWSDRLRVQAGAVEGVTGAAEMPEADVVVVDPPRTGLSPEAADGLLRWGAPRVVYVSCDVPTLARDAARLFAGGYELTSIEAFDMFPGTPHVECLAVFADTGGRG